ncbi:MAG: hypothetical protein HY805_03165 [Nitrospirae bacterium]|nr:hypothetical protein [Nitrospirota bacterium]
MVILYLSTCGMFIDMPMTKTVPKVDVFVDSPLYAVPVNEYTEVMVKVKNKSNEIWPDRDKLHETYISYRWISKENKEVLLDVGLKTPLPHALNPNKDVTVNVGVFAMSISGNYILEFDIFDKDKTLLDDKEKPTVPMSVIIAD